MPGMSRWWSSACCRRKRGKRPIQDLGPGEQSRLIR